MTDDLTRSLTLTKLRRPRIAHGLVRRVRLLEQLNTPHSLTFILAPAGYGKTTLLSTWLETCQAPNAWLSLINVLYHISRPHDALLDKLDASGGTVYRGVADKETKLTEPGLIVYRFDAPLVFANAA